MNKENLLKGNSNKFLCTFLCRVEGEGYVDMKAIIICLSLNSLLLTFEVLICNQMDSLQGNLQSGNHLWLVVFMPLFLTSPMSIAACVWGFRHDRGLEVSCQSPHLAWFLYIVMTNNYCRSRPLGNMGQAIWALALSKFQGAPKPTQGAQGQNNKTFESEFSA